MYVYTAAPINNTMSDHVTAASRTFSMSKKLFSFDTRLHCHVQTNCRTLGN